MSFEAGAVIEVQMHYEVNLQKCMNVWHYEQYGSIPGTVWDAEKAVADQMFADLGVAPSMPGQFRALLSPAANIIRIQCQQVYPVRYRAYYVDVNVAGTYLGGANCNAQNLQASIEKFGIMGTKHDIGAMHIGGLDDTALEDGELTIGYLGALSNFANIWKQPYAVGAPGVGGITPGIVKKRKVVVDGKPYYYIDGLTQLFGVDIKEEIRTMSRRTVGRGI